MTYLQLVNSVLRRMRETETDTIENSNDSYVKLVGEFVNDARRIVEDAWDWSALRTTLIAETQAGVFNLKLEPGGSKSTLCSKTNFFASGLRSCNRPIAPLKYARAESKRSDALTSTTKIKALTR